MFSRRNFIKNTFLASPLVFLFTKISAQADSSSPIPLPPAPFPIPDLPTLPSTLTPQNFHSPTLTPFVDALPIPPVLKKPTNLIAKTSSHKFHRDLLPTKSWGYSAEILGPTIEVKQGQKLDINFKNNLGKHVLYKHIDTTMHGVTPEDKDNPRMVVHLHGAPTEPSSDGNTMVTYRNGYSDTNTYLNKQEAANLWYHDHAMGITRLNVLAGLAGMYFIRDKYDTGKADNPLGLPAEEFEVPLVIQDRIFNEDGSIQPRMERYVPEGFNQSGQFGDVACVNGKAWPFHKVKRTLYRFRILQGSNSRTYQIEFSNKMPFWVIGGDQGLLNKPVKTTSFIASPGERYDILVDFSAYKSGTKIELINTAKNNVGNTVFAVPTLKNLIQFIITPSKKLIKPVPKTLRGKKHQPDRLPAIETMKVDKKRNISMNGYLDTNRLAAVVPAMMTLNNLPFMSDDIDIAKTGTIERWDFINVTPVDHPMHIHLMKFRVIGRRPVESMAYLSTNLPPKFGTRWAPDPDKYYLGAMQPRKEWESGWKDTVYCPTDMVTSVLVYWPTLAELGFNPDAPVKVPEGGEVIQAEHDMATMKMSMKKVTNNKPVKGYVWHCHNLDHEDHDMMQRIKIVPHK